MPVVEISPNKTCYYDGYLQSNLNLMKEAMKHDLDMVIIVDGTEGCLTGDTIINTNRFTLGRKFRLDWLYAQYNGNPEGQPHFKQWNLDEPTLVRSFNGEYVGLHRLKNVTYSGIKEVYEVELANGARVKATADHRIMTREGWKATSNLTNNDEVMIDSPKPKALRRKRPKLYDVSFGGLTHHPHSGKGKRVPIHSLIYEARQNGFELTKYLDIVCNEAEQSRTLWYVNPTTHVIHHVDGNHYNNNTENLQLLTHEEHVRHHATNGVGYKNFHQGIPEYSRVASVTPRGAQKTYDITCEEPHHNFVANGIVVHNSGKSVLAQQIAAYLDPSFNMDRMVLTANDFIKGVKESPKLSAVVYDEAYTGLSSRETMTLTNRTITKMLAEVRQKQLALIICAPSFFDMDKYVALWRSRCLIHVYTGTRLQDRGFFTFYGNTKKKELYLSGKKLYSYKEVKADFFGRFTNTYVLDEQAYRAKKLAALQSYDLKPSEGPVRDLWHERFAFLVQTLVTNKTLGRGTQREIARLLSMEPSSLAVSVRSGLEAFLRNRNKPRTIGEQLSQEVELPIPQVEAQDESSIVRESEQG